MKLLLLTLRQDCSYPDIRSIQLHYKGQLRTWESQNGCRSEELRESVEFLVICSVHLNGTDAFLVTAVRGYAIELMNLM